MTISQDRYVPDFDIKVQGLTLEGNVRQSVLDVCYDNHLDSADMARFRLADPYLQWMDSPLFAVGNAMELRMGYAGQLSDMMLGEIVSVQPAFPSDGVPTLTVSCYDRSHRMRHNSVARDFKAISDSAIAAQLAVEHGLIPVVDPSPMPPRASVQHSGSDWSLINELADRNYFQARVDWDKLLFRFPWPQSEAVVLEWGRSLMAFSPRLSASAQAGLQVVRSYDERLAQTIVAVLPTLSLEADLDDVLERIGGSFAQRLADFGRSVIRDQPLESFVEANVLARSVLQQLMEGLFEGSGACVGLPQLRAGDVVEVKGVGKRFSGIYKLRKVKHEISSNGYRSEFEITQKYSGTLLQSLRQKLTEEPPPHRQQRTPGVVNAIVQANVDPEHLGRVQVSFPHFSDDNRSNWARVATLDAGANSGVYFLPNVGDEVLVSFLHGDPNRPVVIGSLWNGAHRPLAVHADGHNRIRTLRTPAGHEIIFDDADGNASLVVRDANGSRIALMPDGVHVSSRGSLRIEAADRIEIKAASTIQLESANVDVKVSEAMDVH